MIDQVFYHILIGFLISHLHIGIPELRVQLIHDILKGKERKTDGHHALHVPNLDAQCHDGDHLAGGNHLRELGIGLQPPDEHTIEL